MLFCSTRLVFLGDSAGAAGVAGEAEAAGAGDGAGVGAGVGADSTFFSDSGAAYYGFS